MSHSAFNFDGGWFKQLFDSSPDPVWIIDGNRFRVVGVVIALTVNEKAARLAAQTPDLVVDAVPVEA